MKALLVTCSIAAALATAGAAAAAGNGATVVNTSACEPGAFGILVCTNVTTVTNTTVTPNGDISYVTNGTLTATMTFPWGCTYTRTEPVHLHHLVRDGDIQSLSEKLVQTISFTCGIPQTCTQTIESHYANGADQFGLYEFVCTNP